MERIVSQTVLSKELHKHLDQLGFGRQRVREQICFINKCSRAKDISTKTIINTNSIEKIFVGGLQEGTRYSLSNDLDILQINHNVICLADPKLTQENEKVVFKLVQQDTSPGYFVLKLAGRYNENQTYNKIKYALVDFESGLYLSSKLFMDKNDDVFQTGEGFISSKTQYKSPQGPSIPKSTDCGFVPITVKDYLAQLDLGQNNMDFVRAFPCQADWILKEWCLRKREFNWPSKKNIAHVETLPAHVVPVSQTGGTQQDLQWRLCFTLAEIHLVQSFNNTQTKLYVLLKLIAKYYLKHTCPCMTSYVMKTVVLWLAETIPPKKFRKKHLVARLCDALRYLQKSVHTGHLPSYMIPKRNLFAGKLQELEQSHVIEQITFLLHEQTRLISDFLYKPAARPVWVKKAYKAIEIANVYDKKMAETCKSVTSESIAEYFTIAFWNKSKQHVSLNDLFKNDKTLEISWKQLALEKKENTSILSSTAANQEPGFEEFKNVTKDLEWIPIIAASVFLGIGIIGVGTGMYLVSGRHIGPEEAYAIGAFSRTGNLLLSNQYI